MKKMNSYWAAVLKIPRSNSISPVKRSLSLTMGFYLGLFPIIGATTILCVIATFVFRLNTFLVQGMNVLLAPVQLLLIYPFIKIGQVLFFRNNQMAIKISAQQLFEADKWATLYYLLESVIGGIIVWAIISSLTGFFMYRFILRYYTIAID